MARKPSQPVSANSLSHEGIANDIAAFRKRGGRIEVLGITPLRTAAPVAYRSKTTSSKTSKTASAADKSSG